jgi:lactoylglutathione lyase
MQPHISQYRLLVRDFPACFRFYKDVLGLPLGYGSPEEVYADFKLDEQQTLALFKRELMAEVVGKQAAPAQADAQDAALVVFEVDNLDDAVKALSAKGVTFVSQPTDRPEWGMRTAHFRDPDGNLLEIYHPLPMG